MGGRNEMNYKEWRVEAFRSALPKAGPWADEPDQAQFFHKGLLCSLFRSALTGAWNAEVQISYRHPFAHYDIEKANRRLVVHAHGGVCAMRTTSEHAYLGIRFDHAGDVSPMSRKPVPVGAEYRTFSYARAQVEQLASQLAQVIDTPPAVAAAAV